MHKSPATKPARVLRGAAIAAFLAVQMMGQGATFAQSPRPKWTEADAKKDRECGAIILDMGAASSKPEIADIDLLTAIVERFNTTCKGVLGPAEGDVSGLATLAMVHLHQRNFTKAIEVANQCLAVYYRGLECHRYKVEALLSTNQLDKGKVALALALNLADQSIAQAEAGIRLHPQHNGDYKLALSLSTSHKTRFEAMAARLKDL